MNVLGVILAGGNSARMGTDKGLVKYRGNAMVQYAIDLIFPFCDEIVISTNNKEYIKFGLQTIPDLLPGIGPIGGIYSVMNALTAKKYFIVSCDMPHIHTAFAEELIKLSTKADIIVPTHSDGKIEPLFGIYDRNTFGQIKKQIDSENYKLMNLFETSKTCFYKVPKHVLKENPDLFKNINTAKNVE